MKRPSISKGPASAYQMPGELIREAQRVANYADLSLYLVAEGEVGPATPETEWDGTNSILVAATSPEAALVVAEAYDRGELQADNIVWHGQTIAAVYASVGDGGQVYGE